MFSSHKLFTSLLVVAVLGLGYASYAAVGGPSATKAVTTSATVQKGTVLSSITATGNASAATQLGLNFQSSGTVADILVQVGQQVVAGQVLARLNNAPQQSSLLSAEASLASAEAKQAQDQQVETPQQRAVDQSASQAAQASVDTAVVGLGNAKPTPPRTPPRSRWQSPPASRRWPTRKPAPLKTPPPTSRPSAWPKPTPPKTSPCNRRRWPTPKPTPPRTPPPLRCP